MNDERLANRALVFFTELKKNSYPNANNLRQKFNCSRSTAVRDIERMKYEYYFPIEYDQTRHGYYLTDPDFELKTLPPGKDELVALLLASELTALIDDPELQNSITTLWSKITHGRPGIDTDLAHLRTKFSSDNTAIAQLADINILQVLSLCHSGQPVKIQYHSPWRHTVPKEYTGLFEQLHLSDGTLYAKFNEHTGREIVLNLSFLKQLEPLPELPPTTNPTPTKAPNSHWLQGFGIWAGTPPEPIRITIAPPASHYYASQSWHDEQEDQWENDTLTRTIPAIPSPELTRRLLSLGRYLLKVEPPTIIDAIKADVEGLVKLCEGG